jgi:hypothetical protein
MSHSGIQHLPKQSCKDILKPHRFIICHRNCNILSLYGTQSHISLFPATLGNHGRSQTEATHESALPIHYVPCPIIINISLQSHFNTGSISQAISNCSSQVSQHVLCSYPMQLSWLTHELAKCTHCITNIWSGVN